MKGSYKIHVSNSFVDYKLEFEHSISILRGNSGTGKTTLAELLRQYMLNGKSSGITVGCDVPCIVVDADWEIRIQAAHNSIIFIDEGGAFIRTLEFARAIMGTDNYYVLITRENLRTLPYSVDAIYELRGKKYERSAKTFNHADRIYGAEQKMTAPDCLIVEDAKAGYAFFSAFAKKNGIVCYTAEGNANLRKMIDRHKKETAVVIGDGAALGAYMEMLTTLQKTPGYHFFLFLPESLEWLILSSDLLRDKEVRDILQNPSAFIESAQYFSWERFFTALLVDKTKDSYLAYRKDSLNPVYLQPHEMQEIEKNIPIFQKGNKEKI